MPEQNCALRALTLCDGLTAIDWRVRGGERVCWCEALDQALSAGHELLAGDVRTDRARAVARSAETLRTREQRTRWGGSLPAF